MKSISPFAEKGHPREIDRGNEVDKLRSLLAAAVLCLFQISRFLEIHKRWFW